MFWAQRYENSVPPIFPNIYHEGSHPSRQLKAFWCHTNLHGTIINTCNLLSCWLNASLLLQRERSERTKAGKAVFAINVGRYHLIIDRTPQFLLSYDTSTSLLTNTPHQYLPRSVTRISDKNSSTTSARWPWTNKPQVVRFSEYSSQFKLKPRPKECMSTSQLTLKHQSGLTHQNLLPIANLDLTAQ